MKSIQICNWHRVRGGREVVADYTTELLRQKGHDAQLIIRDSRQFLNQRIWKKISAFGRGFYSAADRRFMSKMIEERSPDIVHFHGLFPFFSPWMMVECRRAVVPVVLSCHDYNLTCPTDLHLRSGKICEKCLKGREYWCAILNCRENLPESCAYALRSAFVRKLGLFTRNVDCFIAPSQYARDRLIGVGIPTELISVVPNMVRVTGSLGDPSSGEYAAFAGRIGPEKGVETLLASARMTEIPVRLAGDYSRMAWIVKSAPSNAQFTGLLDYHRLQEFYCKARFLVVPSVCQEIFGLVLVEAMGHGLPVIASRMGGMTEIVEDGVTGLLFDAGNAEDLAAKMKSLWGDPDLCSRMGHAGREKVIREYSENMYYERLITAYKKAIYKCSTQ